MHNGKQMTRNILVVDDDKGIRDIVRDILSGEGYKVVEAFDGTEAVRRVEENDLNLVLLDYALPDFDGIEVLRRVKTLRPNLPILFLTGHGTIDRAVQATKLGAYDFLEKPVDDERLLLAVRNALERDVLHREVELLKDELLGKYEMVGVSEPMQRVYEMIRKVAPSKASVLILGESGVGKELAARAIHYQSPRSGKPFVKLNCAAIPKELVESELFGHEKGAFTGAVAAKPGKVELADAGTLFLDEVGDMDLPAQAKLLRFLQEGEFEHVGGTKTLSVDVRVMAASNKDLNKAIRGGTFREDLYYRLNVVTIIVPPLRDRKQDIPLLADHLLSKACEEDGLQRKAFADGARELLANQPWKGNVRELENAVRRIAVLVDEPVLTADSIMPFLNEERFAPERGQAHGLHDARQEFERDFILRALSKSQWNVASAAIELGVERTYLYRKLKDLNITLSASDNAD